jgi:hypothetical protein
MQNPDLYPKSIPAPSESYPQKILLLAYAKCCPPMDKYSTLKSVYCSKYVFRDERRKMWKGEHK